MSRPAWHKVLMVTLVLAFSTVLGGALLLRWLDPNRHIDFITEHAGTVLGGEVSASAIHWGFDRGVWLQLEQLAMRNATLIPADISAQRIYARAALKPLLRGNLVIEQVAIDAPDITYRVLPATAETTDTEPDGDDESAAFHPPISVLALALRQGRLTIEDHVTRSGHILAHRFEAVDITLGELATGQLLNFTLTADALPLQQRPTQSAGATSDQPVVAVAGAMSLDAAHPPTETMPGTLRFAGHLRGINERFEWRTPWLEADLEIDQLPVTGLGTYLGQADTRQPSSQHLSQHLSQQQEQQEQQEQQLDGHLSARLSYQGDFSARSESRARLELGSIRYRNPELWPQAVPGKALNISAHLQQKGSDLHLNTLTVDAEALSISGTTTLREWRKAAVLSGSALTATLPLAELATLIPWPVLGDAAAPVRRALTNNPGLATVQQLELPAIAIGQPIDATALLAQTRARVTLHNLSVPTGPQRPALEHLEGELQLADNVLHGDHITATFSALRLPDVRFTARQLTGEPQIDAAINGPLNLAEMSTQKKREMLSFLGLEHLDVRGKVALRAHYDHARPNSWRANGYLDIDTLQLTTRAPETRFSARGQIKLRRKRSLDLLIPGIEGRINRSPFAVSGQVFALLKPNLLADLNVMLKGLELERVAPWLDAVTPVPLQTYRLGGRLSTDINLFYQHSDPGKLRVRGPLALRNGRLHLPADHAQLGHYLPMEGLQLEQANVKLHLAPAFYQLSRLSLRANDQLIKLRGKVQNLERPRVSLNLRSPALDLDRLLPATRQAPASEASGANAETLPTANKPAQQARQATTENPRHRALPKNLRHARADLSADITSGRYQGDTFNNLALKASYHHGNIKQASLNIKLAGGEARAQGTAGLLNLNAIPFKLDYQLNKIDLARLTRLLTKDGKEMASGRLTSKASVRGNTQNLKTSLRGELSMRTGPGKIPNRSVAANTLFSILSLINIQGIISGDLGAGLALDGMPYEHVAASARFTSMGLQLEPVELITPAFSTRAIGNVNLGRQDMDMDAVITVLGTLDTVLGFVPLVGRAASDLTKVYLKISGKLTDPRVRVQPAEGLTTGIGSMLEMPLGVLEYDAGKNP